MLTDEPIALVRCDVCVSFWLVQPCLNPTLARFIFVNQWCISSSVFVGNHGMSGLPLSMSMSGTSIACPNFANDVVNVSPILSRLVPVFHVHGSRSHLLSMESHVQFTLQSRLNSPWVHTLLRQVGVRLDRFHLDHNSDFGRRDRLLERHDRYCFALDTTADWDSL